MREGSGFTPFHRGGSGPPLVCLHGFLGSWRIWELALPALERRFEVFAPTLPGHAGGPPVAAEPTMSALLDAVEELLDAAGLPRAHLAGNSLGGTLALGLAARGRAESVVAFAPAGGWRDGRMATALLASQEELLQLLEALAPHVDALVATAEGRRRAMQLVVSRWEHIPAELVAHELLAAVRCDAARALIASGRREEWRLDAERIDCPVRIVWGTEDKLLPWPDAASRYREELPHADWVVLDGVGHCPPLDVPLEAAELVAGFAAIAVGIVVPKP